MFLPAKAAEKILNFIGQYITLGYLSPPEAPKAKVCYGFFGGEKTRNLAKLRCLRGFYQLRQLRKS